MIFLEKVTKVNPSIRGTNLVTIYGFPEGSYVIPNKAAYMDDETLVVVKVVAPGTRKMKVSKLLVFFLSYSLYI